MSDEYDSAYEAANDPGKWIRDKDAEILRLRAEVRLFEIVVCETAKALGVVPDNDAIIEGIESLRAENEKLRSALKPFADLQPEDFDYDGNGEVIINCDDLRVARAAMGETGND